MMVETTAPRFSLTIADNATAKEPRVTKASRTLTAAKVGSKRAQGLTIAAALFACFMTSALPAPAVAAANLSGNELTVYREALRAADAGRLGEATALAARGSNPIAARLVRWIALSTPGGGSFSEIAAFLRENPEWPAQAALKRRAEKEAVQNLDQASLLDWFHKNAPATTDGVSAYADALLATGREDRAVPMLRAFWTANNPSPGDETVFVSRFGRYLRQQDHAQRLTRLLWDRDEAASRRLLPLLDSDHAALAEARLALQRGKPEGESLADAVSGRLARDAGLIYDLARYHRQKNNDGAALAALSRAPDNLERPALWWKERQTHVRRLLDLGDPKAAYKLAASQRADDDDTDAGEAEAEFLAGWIALRFMNEPTRGLKHFERLFNNATAPITLARGAYWAGRAEAADGSQSEARRWYEKAAKYPTTYYGQLAHHQLGRGAVSIPPEPRPSASAESAFERKELVQATRLLAQIAGGSDERTAVFIRRVFQDARTPDELALSARLAQQISRPDLAIAAAKQAAQLHVYLTESGYPILPVARTAQPEGELTHAIIRQESTFNPGIVSPVGARGLMQVMPATGRLTAKNIGVKSVKDGELSTNVALNVKLGSAYLSSMIDRFNGSYAMGAAAYNAGPGRVVRWMEMYGDPRTGATDWVDWVERIPFSETRNYVQRVMEALIVYRARMGGGSTDLYRELTR
jgi:soluble lytic murein transglycosylase